ncbi:hypothetical protein COW36_09380 [bacterium (Candidatus Blackallbacteria) CG17_big_fil_post_rev_8_21_14_2_50_48_46]|uniref:Uncharacterized protein n=1 Tax=bacterium (Candidatus Blackallbacteria) CG17_big_fil_post_rev_8_21_14_2_50_48_46 TaxID=2014261 RepID=A0A2M7G5M7_9BACT|nr:MAG: hypothetical protein COW64_06230 [bacterium (Candidatus Blackallbacteria) CG18_big_fil_WC_8_21_14_2_50_49_26]PIW17273.1 MAG: hypothetical protein COW36_09380 [bacterium (Candidatus Blackallbacteria) CG17_big_fil_post_rev_8_21_14_2_50_48_46]
MSFQSYRQLRQKEAQLVEQIRGEIRLSEPEALVAYLPNFMPPKPVEYIVLAMEPSMAWAKTEEEAQQQVNKGYRNFMHSWEDFLLHHCLKTDLPSYHITDISKAAMTVKNAGIWRDQLYPQWMDLLCQEIELVGAENAVIIPLGAKVEDYLQGKILPRPIAAKMMHFSGNAAKYRKDIPAGFPEEYEEFSKKQTIQILLESAEERLKKLFQTENQIFETPTPQKLIDDRISVLSKKEGVSESRKQLMFTYFKQLTEIVAKNSKR